MNKAVLLKRQGSQWILPGVTPRIDRKEDEDKAVHAKNKE
jgi:hypothetical protein